LVGVWGWEIARVGHGAVGGGGVWLEALSAASDWVVGGHVTMQRGVRDVLRLLQFCVMEDWARGGRDGVGWLGRTGGVVSRPSE